MNRITLAVVTAVLLPVAAPAQPPPKLSFNFRFVEGRDNTIQIIYVDPKGLAGQIGLRQDDVLKRINDVTIRSKRDVDKALETLPGRYRIIIDRPTPRRFERDLQLTGEVKRSRSGYYALPDR
jgi:hypothetical protein